MHMESTLTGCKKFSGVKTILLNAKPESVFKPNQLERAMLLVLLPLFALASIAVSLADTLAGIATWFESYQLPIMALVFLGIWWRCANTRSADIRLVRWLTLATSTGLILERFLLGLHWTVQRGYESHYLTANAVWVVLAACLYVFFVPGRTGLILGLAYYAVVAAAIILFVFVNPHTLPAEVWQELGVSFIIAIPVFLGLVASFSRLMTAYGVAVDRAEDMEHLAMQDGLTGLFNRRAFATSMRRARSRQARRQSPVSMVLLDLDFFKRINDTYGHDAGDDVLLNVSRILTAEMRRTDDIFRWGGEEFVILMEETDADKAGLVADRLRGIIENAKILPKSRVTASFGVTQLIPGEPDSEFFNRADAALYDAKDMGRNRVVVRKRPKRPSDPKVKSIGDMIDSTNF